MLIIDDITIIICVTLLVLSVLSVLLDTFFRKLPESMETADNSALKPVSVIVISDNNSREISLNLPYIFSQDYPAGFEVIVVVSKNEDETDDALKPFAQYPNFYTTFVPDTSRYMSRRKLAVTLGVKAAKNEWILLTDAECKPATDQWLKTMAQNGAEDGVDMVIGYSNYADDARHFHVFDRLHREYAMICEACKGKAYSTAGNNIMFRKSMFMEGDGFRGNLKYIRGEYDFLVNKYANGDNVRTETSLDAQLIEVAPSSKKWRNRQLFYLETRKHLAGGLAHRLRFNADMTLLHLTLWLNIASIAFAAITLRWLILAVAVLMIILTFVVRTMSAKRVIRRFNANIPLWKAVPFELRLIWSNLLNMLRYKAADRKDFISHKS